MCPNACLQGVQAACLLLRRRPVKAAQTVARHSNCKAIVFVPDFLASGLQLVLRARGHRLSSRESGGEGRHSKPLKFGHAPWYATQLGHVPWKAMQLGDAPWQSGHAP